jgi:type IV pilus assembly protein PilB
MAKRLGDLLLERGKITQRQLGDALSKQAATHQKLGEALVSLGYAVEEDVFSALGELWGIPFVRSDEILMASDEAVRIVPELFARENRLIPLAIEDEVLKVAMADPDDIIAIDNLHKLSNLSIETRLAAPASIENAIEQLYVRVRKAGEMTDVIGNLQFFAESDTEEEGLMDMTKVQAGLEDAPVVKLVNLMIADAIRERSTDIHVEVQEEKVSVRFRIDGVLQEVMTPPKASHPGIISRLKILSKLNIAEKRLPQDGRFTILSPEKEVDVRVSILPTVNGEKIVLRLLDKGGFAFNLNTLGMDDQMLMIFRRWIRQPYGMIIISGPTGSGKSTTLYAAVKEIKSTEDNIVTVEDPVEYHLPGINQVQTKPKIGLTFANALRSILRQDPDKLLIGEIRDEETADIAVKFSLTGHLVLSTLHANDAAATITRLLDIGVPPFLAGSCLNLVMAQRLVRRICPQCKEPYTPSEAELESLRLSHDDIKGKTFYRGRGCAHCRHTGYYGRTGIFELLEMRQPIRRLVFDNANEEELRTTALKLGMLTLRDAALAKIYAGITTPHEMLRVTVQEY